MPFYRKSVNFLIRISISSGLLVLALISVVAAANAPFAFYSLTLAVPNSVAVFSGGSDGKLTFVNHVATGDNGIPAGKY